MLFPLLQAFFAVLGIGVLLTAFIVGVFLMIEQLNPELGKKILGWIP